MCPHIKQVSDTMTAYMNDQAGVCKTGAAHVDAAQVFVQNPLNIMFQIPLNIKCPKCMYIYLH